MSTPLVSVIMPVYNSEQYLAEAIESVLNQTHSNFELLITDDGSTDASRQIIAAYAIKDSRIVPTYSEVNLGYVRHLNDGIVKARGEFIARMDSDDISLPARFEQQVNFLTSHPDVAVVGSSTIKMDGSGKDLGLSRRNTSPQALLWQSFFTNPLSHPSVMFRKSVVMQVGLYDVEKMPAEDFDLWTRVLRCARLANIDQPLLRYRMHPMSVSSLKKEIQTRNSGRSLRDHWRYFCGVDIGDHLIKFFKSFHKGSELQQVGETRDAYYLILRLYVRVVAKTGFDRYTERDAFDRLFYLVARSRTSSARSFVELALLLSLFFPLATVKKLITR